MDLNLRHKLGENVRSARQEAGLSKVRLCMMASISRPALNKIESGTSNPKLDTLERLAESLGVPVCDLLK